MNNLEEKIKTGYDTNRPKTRVVIISVLVTALTTVLGIFISYFMFTGYRDKKIKEDLGRFRNIQLQEIRKYEQEQLSTYGYIDKEKGIVRIPIEEAMKKTVELYKKK